MLDSGHHILTLSRHQHKLYVPSPAIALYMVWLERLHQLYLSCMGAACITTKICRRMWNVSDQLQGVGGSVCLCIVASPVSEHFVDVCDTCPDVISTPVQWMLQNTRESPSHCCSTSKKFISASSRVIWQQFVDTLTLILRDCKATECLS